MKRTIILAILDGWGVGRTDESNPIFIANPPNINYFKTHFPVGSLQASGISVGLPWNEEGNSEIGHLTLGAGKIIYQYFPNTVFKTVIPRNVRLAEAPSFGQPITTYDPHSKGGKAYWKLAKEVLYTTTAMNSRSQLNTLSE